MIYSRRYLFFYSYDARVESKARALLKSFGFDEQDDGGGDGVTNFFATNAKDANKAAAALSRLLKKHNVYSEVCVNLEISKDYRLWLEGKRIE